MVQSGVSAGYALRFITIRQNDLTLGLFSVRYGWKSR